MRRIVLLVGLLGFLFQGGCGGQGAGTTSSGGGGSGSGSGVELNGTVTEPSSSTTSISKSSSGLNLSKAVEDSEIVVAKAVTQSPVGGNVKLYNSTGTELSAASVNSQTGAFSATINPTQVGSDNLVYSEVTLPSGEKLRGTFDVKGKAAGDSVSDTIDVKTTLYVEQILEACSSAASLTSWPCSSDISAGTFNPRSMLQTVKNLGGTAGTDTASSAWAAIQQMAESAWASKSGLNLSEMRGLLQGNSTVISDLQGYDSTTKGLSTSALASMMPNFVATTKSLFDDPTTAAKFEAAGADAYKKIAVNTLKDLQSTDLSGYSAAKGGLQSMMKSYLTDFENGSTTALAKFEQTNFARTLFKTCAGAEGKFDATLVSGLKSQFNSGTWDSTKDPTVMKDAFVGLINAGTTSSKVDQWGKIDIFSNPSFYSTAGATFFDNFITTKAQAGSGDSSTPCITSSNCSASQVCATGCGKCVSATNSGSGLARCEVCTASTECGTGNCSSGFCDFPTSFTGDALGGTIFKLDGATCTANAECISTVCSGGVCGASVLSTPTGCSVTSTAVGVNVLTCSTVNLATHYRIYRATATGVTANANNLIATVATFPHSDTGLTSASTYYYVIVSRDNNTGKDSTPSSEISKSPLGLSAPTGCSVDSTTSGVNSVNCTAVNLATHYRIYRGTSTGVTSAGTLVATVTSLPYSDTGLTNSSTYYYVITARDNASNTNSSDSSEVSRSPLDLAAPTGLACSALNKSASCTWTVSATAGAASQKIYKSTSSGFTPSADNLDGTINNNTQAGYTISTLTNGTTYYVRLSALDAYSNVVTTDEVSVTPAKSLVSGLDCTSPSSGAIDCSWNAKSGALNYRLHRRIMSPVLVTSSSSTINAPTTTASLSGLLTGQNYCLAIRWTDDDSDFSGLSSEVCLTTQL